MDSAKAYIVVAVCIENSIFVSHSVIEQASHSYSPCLKRLPLHHLHTCDLFSLIESRQDTSDRRQKQLASDSPTLLHPAAAASPAMATAGLSPWASLQADALQSVFEALPDTGSRASCRLVCRRWVAGPPRQVHEDCISKHAGPPARQARERNAAAASCPLQVA